MSLMSANLLCIWWLVLAAIWGGTDHGGGVKLDSNIERTANRFVLEASLDFMVPVGDGDIIATFGLPDCSISSVHQSSYYYCRNSLDFQFDGEGHMLAMSFYVDPNLELRLRFKNR